MTSKESVSQLIWVQEHLNRIQVAYQKTLLEAPYLREIIYDFTEFTCTLFTITKKAIHLSELVHQEYSASQIGLKLENTERLLREVKTNKSHILSRVKELIEYYNNLAKLAGDISGKQNTELPYDTYRYMKTLKVYIDTEHGNTERQLIGLKDFSQAEYEAMSKISIYSTHASKKKYVEIQRIVARVVKCYIALAGHTQLSIDPIVKIAHEVVELNFCPTCNFVMTIFRLLSPSLASITLKQFINEQGHILSLGCAKKTDQNVLNNSIIYNALFEEIQNFESVDSFQQECAIKIHQYDTPQELEKKMLSFAGKISQSEIWEILKLLVKSFPVQKDFSHSEKNQSINTSSGNKKIMLSVNCTMEGLAKVMIKQSTASLAVDKDIENVRLDRIWLLVSYLSSFLVKMVQ